MIYLLYSQHQKAFHRAANIEEVIETNIDRFDNGLVSDWVVIGEAWDNSQADIEFPAIKELLGRP